MLKINKRFYLVILISLIIYFLWLLNNDNLVLSLFIISLLSLISSYFFTLISVTGLNVIRKSKFNYLQVGSFFMERIEITNSSFFSKWWFVFVDRSPLLSKANSRVITNLKRFSSMSFISTVVLNKRGFYNLGPSLIQSGDPLGLFTKQIEYLNKNHITVYPHLIPINKFPLLSGDESGGENLRLHTTKTTPQAAGLREYMPGDPLNRVHWPMTIKRNKLFVKEFDEDTQSKILIFLDAQKDQYYHEEYEGESAIEKTYLPITTKSRYELAKDGFEYAVSICASLTRYFIQKNKTVGFTCASKKPYIHQADKGERQFIKILETLSIINADGDLPLSYIIEKQRRNIQRGSGLLCITTRIDGPLLNNLMLLKRKGIKSVIIFIDNASFMGSTENDQKDVRGSGIGMIRISYGDNLQNMLSNPTMFP